MRKLRRAVRKTQNSLSFFVPGGFTTAINSLSILFFARVLL